MANMDRIFSPSYVPSHQDIINARVRTTGISKEVYHFDEHIYHVFDVGGERSERKKWIHVFEKADIVLFQVALGAYDRRLSEDHHANQLAESLMVFETFINSPWFTKSTVLLNFTKADIFEQKIKLGLTMPPEDGFSYEGDPTDVLAVRGMITKKFTEVNRNRKKLIVSYMDARDTEQARKLLEGVHACARDRVDHSGVDTDVEGNGIRSASTS
ncbi:guanine nucleotide binding protein, alpha subunit [Chaetomium tenue]|uniref:Guanine nucleotide binding protein, alpha subunit n=1 Tax=Chaetomium tenue TaxID=1854479 RepID=A0ACB7P8G1_9PEZI|nr:guanine nucleotide binding protein, alpha subunit [Chaetomium globosum]